MEESSVILMILSFKYNAMATIVTKYVLDAVHSFVDTGQQGIRWRVAFFQRSKKAQTIAETVSTFMALPVIEGIVTKSKCFAVKSKKRIIPLQRHQLRLLKHQLRLLQHLQLLVERHRNLQLQCHH